jgi:hypothetical protein
LGAVNPDDNTVRAEAEAGAEVILRA